jgi:lipoprotein-releasing system ATP-binding protein
VTLVADADLAVMPGRFTAIVGPSGCGKSSLLYLLGLIDRPSDGLLFDGRDLAKMSGDERARDPARTFRLCVSIPLSAARIHGSGKRDAAAAPVGPLSGREIEARARTLLADVGLEEKG